MSLHEELCVWDLAMPTYDSRKHYWPVIPYIVSVLDKVHNIVEACTNVSAYAVHFLKTRDHPSAVSRLEQLRQLSIDAAVQDLGFQIQMAEVLLSLYSSLRSCSANVFCPPSELLFHVFSAFVYSADR